MKKIALQILGIIVLIPAVGMATLRVENQNADGPSIPVSYTHLTLPTKA